MRNTIYTWLVVSLITTYTLIIPVDPCFALQLQASWYSRASLVKEGTWKNGETMMANGKEFKDEGLTCASWDYPLGTLLHVTVCEQNRGVIVKVTDRTARRFKGKRIDLSKLAFSKIANCKQGIVQVNVEVIND